MGAVGYAIVEVKHSTFSTHYRLKFEHRVGLAEVQTALSESLWKQYPPMGYGSRMEAIDAQDGMADEWWYARYDSCD
jgi:hypothetical protein